MAEASSAVEVTKPSSVGETCHLILQDGYYHADDEEVIGIGEKPHPGDEHDLPVGAGDGGIVELTQEVSVVGCVGGGAHSSGFPRIVAPGQGRMAAGVPTPKCEDVIATGRRGRWQLVTFPLDPNAAC